MKGHYQQNCEVRRRKKTWRTHKTTKTSMCSATHYFLFFYSLNSQNYSSDKCCICPWHVSHRLSCAFTGAVPTQWEERADATHASCAECGRDTPSISGTGKLPYDTCLHARIPIAPRLVNKASFCLVSTISSLVTKAPKSRRDKIWNHSRVIQVPLNCNSLAHTHTPYLASSSQSVGAASHQPPWGNPLHLAHKTCS